MSSTSRFHSAKKYPDPVDATINIKSNPALARFDREDIHLLQNGHAGEAWRTFLGILAAQDVRADSKDGTVEQRYPNFRYEIDRHKQGVRMKVFGAPGVNFDNIPNTNSGERDLVGLRKRHLAAAIRDLIFTRKHEHMLADVTGRSKLVYKMLENAGILDPVYGVVNGRRQELGRVNAWGGHHIGPQEYDYVVEVGEQLGHDAILTTTGGGPGTMRAAIKGNMTGLMEMDDGYSNFTEAGWGRTGRYGFTVPEIITASEPPNKYIQNLVVLPEVELRLEAFIRANHGTIIFPGGAGTAEEFMIILAVKMHEANAKNPHPLIITGPEGSRDYLEALDMFIVATLGEEAKAHYGIVIDNPNEVGQIMSNAVENVRNARDEEGEPFVYNNGLLLPSELTEVFETTHESVAALNLTHDNQEPWQLAGQLRRLFKSIVRGSIIDRYKGNIARHGKYQLRGDPKIVNATIDLLDKMDAQHRLSGVMPQEPCYEVVQA